MSRLPVVVLVALLAAVGLSNCGDAREVAPGDGTTTDGGSAGDGGPSPDGGSVVDAGQTTDGGPRDGGHDAGQQGSDAGSGEGDCNNAADIAALGASGEQMAIQSCAQNNLNTSTLMLKEPQALQCIQNTGLSMACAVCIDANANCTIVNCLTACIGGDTPGCRSCRATNCDQALLDCAGVAP